MVDYNKTYVGIVVDNNDPRKEGRLRIKVVNVFDNISDEDIPWASPWKDLNGNTFNLPDVGKIVTVVFNGDIYKPEYISSEHFNINLESKLLSLDDNEYKSLKALLFDHSTQIYRTNSEGLKIDHEFTNINLDSNGNILLNLRDNKSVITLGSRDSDEEAVLGTTFFAWMDDFMDTLLTDAYLDSMGAPIVPTPSLLNVVAEYNAMRDKFVSEHVRLPKNGAIIAQKRDYNAQYGDNWVSSKGENNLTSNGGSGYNPSSSVWDGFNGTDSEYSGFDVNNPANYNPNDMMVAAGYDIPTSNLDKSKYQNGRIPTSALKKSKWLNGDKSGKWISSNIKGKTSAYLISEASDAFDALFDLYEKTNFKGKAPLLLIDGYRTYQEQVNCYNKYGAGWSATPGKSNHGWAIAVDISGIANPNKGMKKMNKIKSAFRTPVYKWLFENSWQFGIYNPESLRDGSGVDEYWHWEYLGKRGKPVVKNSEYAKVFTKGDYQVLRSSGVSSPSDKYIKPLFES